MIKQILFLLPALGLGIASQAEARTLQETLEGTYNFSPRIKVERETVKTTDEQVSQALSEWRPTMRMTYEKGRQKNVFNDMSVGNPYDNMQMHQWVVDQPLFNGGGTIARTSGAKASVRAARARLTSIEQEVLLSAITAHMNVYQDAKVVELTKNREGVLKKQLDASNERFKVGEITRTDVAQSEARQSSAAADRIQAEGNYNSSLSEYLQITGMEAKGLEAPTELPPMPTDLKQAIDAALANNPDLRNAVFNLKAAGHEVNSRKSRLLPTASLHAEAQNQNNVQGRPESFDDQRLTLQVNVPLYQSGAEYSRVREGKRIEDRREEELAVTRDGVIARVTQAWETWQANKATITSRNDAIKAAQVALEGVELENQYGTRTTLDVLDAQQELFQVKVALVRAERDQIVNAYTLLSAMGSLTAESQKLNVNVYDPDDNYRKVKFLPLGY